VRLLELPIAEPVPGNVLPEIARFHGTRDAARCYRALVLTTLRQLRGLQNVRLRLMVSPSDALEAVRFWLLPLLGSGWQESGGVYRLDGWEIEFADELAQPPAALIRARGDLCCPELGARWVHTALLGLGRTVNRVIGPATAGGTYFEAVSSSGPDVVRTLPVLTVVHTTESWQAALDGPLGCALGAAWDADQS
jgi:glycosyltransferase A (GT-A) superfamily protein (DUF2064 family)